MTRLFRLLRPSRPMTALALSIAVVTLALTIPAAVAQSSRKLPPGLASANVAINEGRYDEVATLTAQLDAQDPAVVAVRARAMIARGRYDEASRRCSPRRRARRRARRRSSWDCCSRCSAARRPATC